MKAGSYIELIQAGVVRVGVGEMSLLWEANREAAKLGCGRKEIDLLKLAILIAIVTRLRTCMSNKGYVLLSLRIMRRP